MTPYDQITRWVAAMMPAGSSIASQDRPVELGATAWKRGFDQAARVNALVCARRSLPAGSGGSG